MHVTRVCTPTRTHTCALQVQLDTPCQIMPGNNRPCYCMLGQAVHRSHAMEPQATPSTPTGRLTAHGWFSGSSTSSRSILRNALHVGTIRRQSTCHVNQLVLRCKLHRTASVLFKPAYVCCAMAATGTIAVPVLPSDCWSSLLTSRRSLCISTCKSVARDLFSVLFNIHLCNQPAALSTHNKTIAVLLERTSPCCGGRGQMRWPPH